MKRALAAALSAAVAFGAIAAEGEKRVEEWERGRGEVLRWFSLNQFGETPLGRPADQRIGEREVEFAGGRLKISISLSLPEGAGAGNPAPVFVFGDHSSGPAPDFAKTVYKGIPTNTITSRGYALVYWNMNDVCPNAARYMKNLDRWADGVIAWHATGDAKSRAVERGEHGWGTLGAWAWGYARVMDWIETRPELDAKRVAAIGHSRGGKTALWAVAQDLRYRMAVSNNSGCGGAKLNRFRAEKSEHIAQILHQFPNWFAPAYAKWIGRDAEIERDSDDLLRLIAPRLCCVGSAEQDPWAGPAAERAACESAKELWRAYGAEENLAYRVRPGKHMLTAEDWAAYLDFADRRMK